MSWTIVAALSCVLVLAFVIPMVSDARIAPARRFHRLCRPPAPQLNDSGLLRNLVYRGAELCRPVRGKDTPPLPPVV